MIRGSLTLALAAICFTACSTTPKQTAKGRAVKIIKSPFAESCIQLGYGNYEGTPFIRKEELLIQLRELSANMGGNAMKIEIFSPGVTGVRSAKGRNVIYKCQKEKLAKQKNVKIQETDPEGKPLNKAPQ